MLTMPTDPAIAELVDNNYLAEMVNSERYVYLTQARMTAAKAFNGDPSVHSINYIIMGLDRALRLVQIKRGGFVEVLWKFGRP